MENIWNMSSGLCIHNSGTKWLVIFVFQSISPGGKSPGCLLFRKFSGSHSYCGCCYEVKHTSASYTSPIIGLFIDCGNIIHILRFYLKTIVRNNLIFIFVYLDFKWSSTYILLIRLFIVVTNETFLGTKWIVLNNTGILYYFQQFSMVYLN